jgi:nucleotide-binding universal stress UspA family protein
LRSRLRATFCSIGLKPLRQGPAQSVDRCLIRLLLEAKGFYSTGADRTMNKDYRILVAIDLKPGTDRLLAEAQRYAQALDAIVDIVHVADPDPDFVGYIKDTDEAKTGARGATNYDQTLRDDRAKEFHLEHQQAHVFADKMRASGIRVEQALTVQGPPLETLLEEARKLRTDLLILGSHHHSALYRLWYGDIAVDAAKKAPCALLVVPV